MMSHDSMIIGSMIGNFHQRKVAEWLTFQYKVCAIVGYCSCLRRRLIMYEQSAVAAMERENDWGTAVPHSFQRSGPNLFYQVMRFLWVASLLLWQCYVTMFALEIVPEGKHRQRQMRPSPAPVANIPEIAASGAQSTAVTESV